MHQFPEMLLPFISAGALPSLAECAFKHLERGFVKIFVNTVGVRRLITVGPQPISIVILLNTV